MNKPGFPLKPRMKAPRSPPARRPPAAARARRCWPAIRPPGKSSPPRSRTNEPRRPSARRPASRAPLPGGRGLRTNGTVNKATAAASTRRSTSWVPCGRPRGSPAGRLRPGQRRRRPAAARRSACAPYEPAPAASASAKTSATPTGAIPSRTPAARGHRLRSRHRQPPRRRPLASSELPSTPGRSRSSISPPRRPASARRPPHRRPHPARTRRPGQFHHAAPLSPGVRRPRDPACRDHHRADGLYEFSVDDGRAAASSPRRGRSRRGSPLSRTIHSLGDGDRAQINLVAPTALQPLDSELERLSADRRRTRRLARLAQAQENAERQTSPPAPGQR
jgi:hypothetical protein